MPLLEQLQQEIVFIAMRSMLYLFLLWPLFSQSANIIQCEGTVLERRLALAEAGEQAEVYLSTNNQLGDFCLTHAESGGNQTSHLLKNSLACESNEKNIVYYVCELSRTRDGSDQVKLLLESCSYSLQDKAISCENNSVVTTFSE